MTALNDEGTTIAIITHDRDIDGAAAPQGGDPRRSAGRRRVRRGHARHRHGRTHRRHPRHPQGHLHRPPWGTPVMTTTAPKPTAAMAVADTRPVRLAPLDILRLGLLGIHTRRMRARRCPPWASRSASPR
ncbi:hypothetical protein ACRAWF_26265 [Streptomyces sp. L7]